MFQGVFCALSVVVRLHACNTHAQHKILVFYLQAFYFFFFFSVDLESVEEGRSPVPLSALDTVALAAHYSFLLASVSKLSGRRPQVRVSARARWGPGRGAFSWPGETAFSALLQMPGVAKNGNFVGLISAAPVPVWVPWPHLLSRWFQRLIYLLWLYSKVQGSLESAIWPNVWKQFLSLLSDSRPSLGGVGFSPGPLMSVAGAGGFYVLDFLWVGEWWHTHNETTQRKFKDPIYILSQKARKNQRFPQIVSFLSTLNP